MVKTEKLRKSACPNDFQRFKIIYGISGQKLYLQKKIVLVQRGTISKEITKPFGQMKINDKGCYQ